MELFIIVSLLLAFVPAWLVYTRWRASDLPPGPPPLPIFGNIFQLGPVPHTSFARLAETYGPLMYLKLGTQLAVVVSSPEMAKEIMKNQDQVFVNRSNPAGFDVHGNKEVSIGWLPGNSSKWKKLRRICKEHLFSNQALHASKDLRQEALRKLAGQVSASCGGVMDVGEATFATMTNLLFFTLFSRECDPGSNRKLQEHVSAIARYIGLPNVSDFFPVFAPLDPQGLRRKMGRHFGGILEIVGTVIEQRLKQREAYDYRKRNDFLETLLDLMEGDEYDLSLKEIKHLIMDLIMAGSDSSAASAEWTMVELLLHPEILAKVKAELKSVIGDKRIVEESDISKLPYLKATVKESLRFHPPAPLLIPREAVEETRVNGHRIPKGTKVFINFWAITRDPSIWKDPESFEPERFLGKDIDWGGQHFELIPLGSGRRMCPGLPLATRMVHNMVATLCHNFDWKLERGAESKSLQREDVFGLALLKKTPLRAIPMEA